MKYILIIIIAILFQTGCRNETDEKKELSETEKKKLQEEMEFSRKVIGAEIRKGMYAFNSNTPQFLDCSSGKRYLLAGSDETEEIRKAFQDKKNVNQSGLAYIEIEAFKSTQNTGSENTADTVLVVTKFIKFDNSRSCD